jgi:hypothetical protein
VAAALGRMHCRRAVADSRHLGAAGPSLGAKAAHQLESLKASGLRASSR